MGNGLDRCHITQVALYFQLNDLTLKYYSITCLIQHAWGEKFDCWNRQGVRLHSVMHIENGQKCMKINVG